MEGGAFPAGKIFRQDPVAPGRYLSIKKPGRTIFRPARFGIGKGEKASRRRFRLCRGAHIGGKFLGGAGKDVHVDTGLPAGIALQPGVVRVLPEGPGAGCRQAGGEINVPDPEVVIVIPALQVEAVGFPGGVRRNGLPDSGAGRPAGDEHPRRRGDPPPYRHRIPRPPREEARRALAGRRR